MIASVWQKEALRTLAGSRDRGKANRARAVLLTRSGWTSARIAEAFGVGEDTGRLWHPRLWHDFVGGGVDAPKTSPAPGPAPGQGGGGAAGPFALADRRMAAQIRTRIQRHRGRLTRSRPIISPIRPSPTQMPRRTIHPRPSPSGDPKGTRTEPRQC